MKIKVSMQAALLSLLALALILSGCGGDGSEPAAAGDGETYKIGAILAITGPASSLGIPERDTMLMLQEELDAAGGILGPDGLKHPVEIIIYDTESDETKAVLAAKKLIDEDQVALVIGPTQSGTTLALVDTMQKAEVPLISCAASIKIVEPAAERTWVFKTAPSDRLVVGALIDHLVAQGLTKVAWISLNNAFGDSGKVEFEAAAPAAGIEIVASEKFEAADTDMTAQLTKIRGTDAQALVVWAIPPSASAVTKSAYDLGMELPIFHSHGVANQAFIDLASAEAAEGVIFPTGKIIVADQLPDSDPQKAVLVDYVGDYSNKYNLAPVTFGGHAWDGVKLAVQVMEKVGTDRAKIRDELEKTQGFVGIGGVFDFSAEDHNGLDKRAITMVQIRDGAWQLADQ
jgi:branched-chain amino acid transport system substrate-binding protein